MESLRFFERFRKIPEMTFSLLKSAASKLHKSTPPQRGGYPRNRTPKKSRQKKKISDNGFFVFFIAMTFSVTTLIILVVLLPVSLLALWIVCSLNYTYIRRAKVRGAVSDFWLDEKQAEDYLSAAVPYYKARAEIKEAFDRGSANNLTKRSSRRFDEGSPLGKELNSIIRSNEKTMRQYQYFDKTLEEKPLSKWMVFKREYINSRSYGAGFVTWLAATVFSIHMFSSDFVSGFKRFFLFPFFALEDLPGMVEGFFEFQLRFGKLTMDDWIMVLLPTLAAYCGYCLTGLLIRNRAGRISPEPPLVNIENAARNVRKSKAGSIPSREWGAMVKG